MKYSSRVRVKITFPRGQKRSKILPRAAIKLSLHSPVGQKILILRKNSAFPGWYRILSPPGKIFTNKVNFGGSSSYSKTSTACLRQSPTFGIFYTYEKMKFELLHIKIAHYNHGVHITLQARFEGVVSSPNGRAETQNILGILLTPKKVSQDQVSTKSQKLSRHLFLRLRKVSVN